MDVAVTEDFMNSGKVHYCIGGQALKICMQRTPRKPFHVCVMIYITIQQNKKGII